jgi:uncharacterized delta-60 repeat protein
MAIRRWLQITLFATTLLAARAHALLLDTTFGVGGRVSALGDQGVGVVLEPGAGRILVLSEGFYEPAYLARYLPDGTADLSFGTDGRVQVDNDSPFGVSDHVEDIMIALARQPLDGKLLVVGYETIPSGVDWIFKTFLRRYDAGGSLDIAFGSGGTVTLDQPEYPRAVVVLPDGRIAVAGHDFGYPGTIVRLLSDGTPDPAFGSGGVVVTGTAPGSGNLLPAALLVVGADTLVAGGTDDHTSFVLARYASDGTIDGTFGVGGFVSTRPPDVVGALEVDTLVGQADGKILAIGSAPQGTGSEFRASWVVARYQANGTGDASYGSAGALVGAPIRMPPHTAAVLDGDGLVVAAGSLSARLTADGVLDPGFAPCVVAFDPSMGTLGAPGNVASVGIARQDDGKLLIAGMAEANIRINRYVPGLPTCMPASPRGSKLLARGPHTGGPSIKWSWRSNATVTQSDFGSPINDNGKDGYTVCLLDATSPSGWRGSILSEPKSCEVPRLEDGCWTAIRTGYHLKERRAGRGPLDIFLRAGDAKHGRIIVKGSRDATAPVAPPPYTSPVVMRIERSGSPFCWDATFSAAAHDDATRFLATSD